LGTNSAECGSRKERERQVAMDKEGRDGVTGPRLKVLMAEGTENK
jgi:hypothetical protein